MERTIRRLLLSWLLLLGGVLLTQHLGWTRLAYCLLWPVALTTPVVAGLQLWLAGLRLREAWWRVQRATMASQAVATNTGKTVEAGRDVAPKAQGSLLY